jgi:hypothetical protein
MLSLMALYFFTRDNFSTFTISRKDLVVDTALVDKIHLKCGVKEVELSSTLKKWKVDEYFSADANKIRALLASVLQIDLRSSVSHKDQDRVMRELINKGLNLTFFQGQRLLQNYILYNDTSNHQIFLKPGKSDKIYYIENKWNLFMSPVDYLVNQGFWRDKSLFHFTIGEIASVQVQYPPNPCSSFEIIHNGNGKFQLFAGKERKEIPSDPEKITLYLSLFEKVDFEKYIFAVSDAERKSLSSATPTSVIILKDIFNHQLLVKNFPMSSSKYDKKGTLGIDPYRMYAYINDADKVIVKYVDFDPLLANPAAFAPENNVNP